MNPLTSILRVTNTVLRGSLIFILASILPENTFGTFALVTSTISYSILFLGFDLYIHTTRHAQEAEDQQYISNTHQQIHIIATAYLIAIPAFLFFTRTLLDPRHQAAIVSLAVVEHINQELYRILISRGLIIRATLATLLRSGAWLILLAPEVLRKHPLELMDVLQAWLLFSVLAAGVSLDPMNRNILKVIFSKINKNKSNSILKSSLKFWSSTLAFRAGGVLDRWFVAATFGAVQNGRYALLYALATIFSTLFETLSIEPRFHRVLKAKERHIKLLRRRIRSNLIRTYIKISLIASITTAALLIATKYFFHEKISLDATEFVLFSMLAGITTLHIFTTSTLYALGEDRQIILGNYAFATTLITLLALGTAINSLFLTQASVAAATTISIVIKSSKLFKNEQTN